MRRKTKKLEFKKAYTLIELMIALFLSSLIMLGLYGFIGQFRLAYTNIGKSAFQNSVYREFIELLKTDLSFTNSVKIENRKEVIVLEYLIPRLSEKKQIINGKKCKIVYNKKKNQLVKEDIFFQWDVKNFIDKNFTHVSYLNTLEKTYSFRKKFLLNFTLRYSSYKKIRPISVEVLKRNWDDKIKNKIMAVSSKEIIVLGNS